MSENVQREDKKNWGNMARLEEYCPLIKRCLVTLCNHLKIKGKINLQVLRGKQVIGLKSQGFIMLDRLDFYCFVKLHSDWRECKLQMECIRALR